jgi:hypothetical protein
VAGSFQNNLAAWEELLGGSTRQSSKKALKWIRDGVQPIFEGTQNADPKKMRRVRSLLRRTVPKGQVETYLSGTVPPETEFQNHLSVYEHLPFSVKAVRNLVVTGTSHMYSPEDKKPKVVNPLGVALNRDKERLVLNGMFINSFIKNLPFQIREASRHPHFPPEGRLHLILGPEERVFPRFDTPQVPDIFRIPVRGAVLPLQRRLLWVDAGVLRIQGSDAEDIH